MRRAVSSYIGKASKDFGAEEEVIGAGGGALVLSYSGLHLYEEAVSWVPSPLAGEGQGEGKSGGNASTHPNEKCCSNPCRSGRGSSPVLTWTPVSQHPAAYGPTAPHAGSRPARCDTRHP